MSPRPLSFLPPPCHLSALSLSNLITASLDHCSPSLCSSPSICPAIFFVSTHLSPPAQAHSLWPRPHGSLLPSPALEGLPHFLLLPPTPLLPFLFWVGIPGSSLPGACTVAHNCIRASVCPSSASGAITASLSRVWGCLWLHMHSGVQSPEDPSPRPSKDLSTNLLQDGSVPPSSVPSLLSPRGPS